MPSDPSPPAAPAAVPDAHVAPDGGGRPLWQWRACLALPFVLCAAYLLASGREFIVFWGNDEVTFHWPLIRRFARELPHLEFNYPLTATTPLFHWLGAAAVRAFGENIQLVRMLNALVSLGGVFALFGLLTRSRRHPAGAAALLTVVFFSSCYFFGYSFRLLTDNMALTWCLLAMAQLYRFAETAEEEGLRAFVWGCVWLCLAILTRQTSLFLGLPFLVALLTSPVASRQKITGLIVLALTGVPYAGFVLIWHGLVPPDFQQRHASTLIHGYAPALPLMLLGLYAPFILGPGMYHRLAARRFELRRLRWPAVAALLGLVIVAAFPLYPLAGQQARAPYLPAESWAAPNAFFAGWFYFASSHLPVLRGNSVLFWLLLPLGLAVATGIWIEGLRPGAATAKRLPALFLLAVAIISLMNPIAAQKYYDTLMLLVLLWLCPPEPGSRLLRNLSLVGLVAAFCVYYVIYIFFFRPGTVL